MGRPSGVSATGATPKYLNIISRDPCVFCGRPSESFDHIEPIRGHRRAWHLKSTGFSVNHWTNFAPCCLKCNQQKGALKLLNFLIKRRANV